MLRGLVTGRIEARGAQACVGLVTLDEIVDELAGLPITTRADIGAPDAPTLLQRVLGDAMGDCRRRWSRCMTVDRSRPSAVAAWRAAPGGCLRGCPAQ